MVVVVDNAQVKHKIQEQQQQEQQLEWPLAARQKRKKRYFPLVSMKMYIKPLKVLHYYIFVQLEINLTKNI